ncbi:MAG: glutathione S-transferase N-terminal domain-containing protein [Pseudomonadota bacterium]
MKVEVYGVNHSPWVQAVLLGLHERDIPYALVSVPPGEVLKRWGVFMPAVSIDGGPWEVESAEILVKLGFDPIAVEDLQAVRTAWRGVQHRTDNPFKFFAGFSRCADQSTSFAKRTGRNFLRSFITFYMFTLINFVKLNRKPQDPQDWREQYLYWEKLCNAQQSEFFDGSSPGSRDLLLFGIVQCHASIPVPPLQPLRDDPRLTGMRQWLGAMQRRFADYPHMYSGSYFTPPVPQPTRPGRFQQGVFFLGLASMFLALPITLPLVFVLMRKVPR